MIKKILFLISFLLLLLPFSSAKALEQDYTIDLFSFTWGAMQGDLNTGCSFKTNTVSFSSDFSQYITMPPTGGYCETVPSGMTIGMNVTTPIEDGVYYQVTETLGFGGSIQYLTDAVNLYTQCGVYNGTSWDLNACEDVVVTSSNPQGGYVDITITFKAKTNGTKYTLTIGSMEEGYKMFYSVGNGGVFNLHNMTVEKLSSSGDSNVDLGPIINQNQTIINQNNQINNNLQDINSSINSDNVDDFSDTINSFEGFLQENSTITKLVTLPVTLYSSILNNINSTCSPFNLGSLYGEPLILPCINIGNYLGSTLWGMIDLIISGFAIYAISKKFIKIFNNFSTLKEGDILDD